MVDTSLVTNLLAVDKMSSVLEKIGGNFGTFGKVAAAGLVAAGGGAIAAGKLLYEVGATFDDLSDTIRTGTGATGKALDGLVDVAKNVGRNVPVEFDKIGPVVADLNTRLGLTGDTLDTVASQFLQAGQILGEDVDIQSTTAALSVFGIQGDQVAGALDELFRVSQATGVGMNELAGTMNKSGGVVQQLGFSFSETASLIGVLDKAGIDSDAVLASMGKSLVTLAKSGEDAPAAFRRVTSEMKDLLAAGDQTAALDLASQVFGTRGAAQFVAALQTGKVNIDDMAAAAGLSSDTILGVAEDTADMSESWQLFKNRALLAIEPVATRVFNALGGLAKSANDVVAVLFSGDYTGGLGGEDSKVVDYLFRIRDGAAEVGQWVKGTLIPALSELWTVFKSNVLPVLQSVGSYMTGTLIPGIVSFGGWIQKYKGWLLPVAAGITAMVVAWKLYTTTVAVVSAVTKAYAAVQAALNVVMAANPIGLIVLALVGLVAGLVYAYTASETFRDIVNGAFGAVLGVITGVWNWISSNWPLLLAILTGPIGLAVLAIVQNWDTIMGGVTATKDWIVARFNDVVGFLTGIPGRVSAALGGIWDGITGGISNAYQWVVDRINDIVGFVSGLPQQVANALGNLASFIAAPFIDAYYRIVGWVDKIKAKATSIATLGGTFGNANAADILDIPGRAVGGPVSAGMPYIVGEKRPELFIPDTDGLIVPQVPSSADGGGNYYSGGGGESTVRLIIDGTGILSGLRKEVRVRAGGNVQLALGT